MDVQIIAQKECGGFKQKIPKYKLIPCPKSGFTTFVSRKRTDGWNHEITQATTSDTWSPQHAPRTRRYYIPHGKVEHIDQSEVSQLSHLYTS